MNTKADAQQVLIGTTMIARVDAWREQQAQKGVPLSRRSATETLLAIALSKPEHTEAAATGSDGRH